MSQPSSDDFEGFEGVPFDQHGWQTHYAPTELELTRDRLGIWLSLVLIIVGGLFIWAGLAVGLPFGAVFHGMGGFALIQGLYGIAVSTERQYRDERGTPVFRRDDR